jgi:hypothetical protein
MDRRWLLRRTRHSKCERPRTRPFSTSRSMTSIRTFCAGAINTPGAHTRARLRTTTSSTERHRTSSFGVVLLRPIPRRRRYQGPLGLLHRPPDRHCQHQRIRRIAGGSASPLLHQQLLPVSWNASGWSGYRLVDGMMLGRCEARPFHIFVGPVIPEPILTWLETPDDIVTRRLRMCGGVLAWRIVATSDVAALRAST